MRRHHTGSGRAPFIQDDWESTHERVVTEQHLREATVALRKPGGTSSWNEGLGRTVTVPFLPFAADVPARISPITGNEVSVVEERQWILGYRVTVPSSLAPSDQQLDEGIEIFVQTCSDPMLVGVTMSVSEVTRGTHLFQRDLVAQVNS